jgi:hypothetical protein
VPADLLDVKQVEAILDEWVEGPGESWNEVGSTWKDKEGEDVPGLGMVTRIADHGGSDQGSAAWVVLKVGSRLFRKTGFYASYDGFTWDGDFRVVEAKPKTITVYENV